MQLYIPAVDGNRPSGSTWHPELQDASTRTALSLAIDRVTLLRAISAEILPKSDNADSADVLNEI